VFWIVTPITFYTIDHRSLEYCKSLKDVGLEKEVVLEELSFNFGNHGA